RPATPTSPSPSPRTRTTCSSTSRGRRRSSSRPRRSRPTTLRTRCSTVPPSTRSWTGYPAGRHRRKLAAVPWWRSLVVARVLVALSPPAAPAASWSQLGHKMLFRALPAVGVDGGRVVVALDTAGHGDDTESLVTTSFAAAATGAPRPAPLAALVD